MMGMLGNKRGMASAILSEIPKIDVKDVPVGLEADFGKACEACASDLIEAVKAGEPGKVVRAMKSLMQMIDKEDEYSEPSEE